MNHAEYLRNYRKELKEKNPEKYWGWRRKVREQLKGKPQSREYKQKWYEENKEKAKEQMRAWQAENPRKTRKKFTPSWLSREQKKEMKGIYQTARDLSKSIGISHHVDHIIPLKGKKVRGLHVPWNLQVITAGENLKKGNRV